MFAERGRYYYISRHNEACQTCCSDEVDDKINYHFNCDSLKTQRKNI